MEFNEEKRTPLLTLFYCFKSFEKFALQSNSLIVASRIFSVREQAPTEKDLRLLGLNLWSFFFACVSLM